MSVAEPELVYRFSELSEHAKDRVRQWYNRGGWDRADDYFNSLKALVKHFDGRLADWDIDWAGCGYSRVRFSMPEFYDSACEDEDGNPDEEKLEALKRAHIGARLAELGEYDPETLKGTGECKLTGWSYDESAIDGFRRAFFDGESDLDELMQAAFHSLSEAARKDYEYDYSDEAIIEAADVNEWWFDEDGKLTEPPDPNAGRYSKTRYDLAQMVTSPHARCKPGVCVENAYNKRVPRCELGRAPKSAGGRSKRAGVRKSTKRRQPTRRRKQPD